mmetsp:Transcript_1399/g.2014  ORF Transcript_1399/g.2014 Transcript_1399/m.2014 type:complete len:224 (+) Transcript_1399:802-1473(+)
MIITNINNKKSHKSNRKSKNKSKSNKRNKNRTNHPQTPPPPTTQPPNADLEENIIMTMPTDTVLTIVTRMIPYPPNPLLLLTTTITITITIPRINCYSNVHPNYPPYAKPYEIYPYSNSKGQPKNVPYPLWVHGCSMQDLSMNSWSMEVPTALPPLRLRLRLRLLPRISIIPYHPIPVSEIPASRVKRESNWVHMDFPYWVVSMVDSKWIVKSGDCVKRHRRN